MRSLPAPARRAAGLSIWRLGAVGTSARSLVALGALVGLAQSATVVVQAVLIAEVIQRGLFGHPTAGAIAPQLVGIGAALAARGLLGWAGEWAGQRAASAVAGPLRRRVLSQMLALGPSWLARERAGELALLAAGGVDSVGVYVGRYLPQLAVAALAPIGVLVWVGATDWVSLLILLVLVAAVPPTTVALGRRAAEAAARQWRGMSSLSARLLELISGLPTLRAFGRVEFGRRDVAEATESLRRSTLRTLRVAFLSSLALELLAGLGTGLVAMVLGLRMLDGRISLAVALAVLLVSPEVFVPMRRAAAEFHRSAEGQAAAERIATVLETSLPRTRPGLTTTIPDPRQSVLVLDAVLIEHLDGGRSLGPLSLQLEPGQRTALIGVSGSGKSTALAAILGLVPLSAGRIMIGGVDVGAVDPTQWRRHVAWVPQRPHLFSGTIADNLHFARPDAGPAELDGAITTAGLDQVLERLPRGLETPVGEGGAGLSAGERHRIAIARAVLHGGAIVLLDEIGAHLDPDGRDRLRASIEPWLQGRTVLVATHRPDVVAAIGEVVGLEPAPPIAVPTPQ